MGITNEQSADVTDAQHETQRKALQLAQKQQLPNLAY